MLEIGRSDFVPAEALARSAEGYARMPAVLQHLGFDKLRAGQDRAVASLMLGRDSIVMLPTSTGKTACFIVPALCMKWRTVVIYPLRALIRDQEQSMLRKGLAAAAISSDTSDGHNANVLREWASGDLQFMLVSPERFANEEWVEIVRQVPPDFVALDEAHTLEQWGDNFRPGFKRACEVIREINPKVVAAFSATLSESAEAMARELLGVPKAALVYHYERRSNLLLRTAEFERAGDAFPFIANKCVGPTVAYCSTVRRVEEYTETMQKITRRPVIMYHGKMKPSEKTFNQDKFLKSDDAIILATNAFGMGVDKPNVRNVVHMDIPGNLVAVAQECVHPGSMISTASGLKLASEVVLGEKMLDYNFGTGQHGRAMTTQAMKNKSATLVEVRTKLGSTLRVSPNHPVFVWGGDGAIEVSAANLKVGDQLLAQSSMPPATEKPIRTFDLLVDCPEPVFVKVTPAMVDRLRAALTLDEIRAKFRLSRLYDYTAYRRSKHGRLDYWLEACAAAGISVADFERSIVHFKTRSSQRVKLPTCLGADFGWWFGVMATDGNVQYNPAGTSGGYGSWRVRLGTTSEAIAAKFNGFLVSLGLGVYRSTREPNDSSLAKKPIYLLECSHPIMVHLCRKLGIPERNKTYDVSVPSLTRLADVAFRAGFLAGVIDKDGCLASDKYQLRVHSASWEFLSGVSMLMRSFGVPSTSYAEDYTCKVAVMKARADHGYSLRVSSTEYYEKLRDVVAPHSCKVWQPVRLAVAGYSRSWCRGNRRAVAGALGSTWLVDEVLEIADVEYNGAVLNWRVEPGNQLVVDGVLTHNCGRAGRDGKNSWCYVILTKEGIRTQRFFIDCGHPTERDIRKFIAACNTMANPRTGLVEKQRADIMERAGLSVQMSQSIMAFCLGERLVEADTAAARLHLVKFQDVTTWTPPEKTIRDAVLIVGNPAKTDGWLEVDVDQLAEQSSRSVQTCTKRLSEMFQAGKIDYVRPATTRPLRMDMPLSSVTRETWDRLNSKAEQAHAKLEQVLEYCATADDEKHAFLESHLNR